MAVESDVPQPMIIAIERDSSFSERTRKALLPLIDEPLGVAITLCVGDGRDALKRTVGSKFVEPCLVVTDHEGLEPRRDCVVGKIKKLFKRPAVILYSASATEREFTTWKQYGLVDDYVPKQEPNIRILTACRRALKEYFSDDVLN